jgi:hypothetical protein
LSPRKDFLYRIDLAEVESTTLFIWLIIRFIQLVFSARTIFFSQKKSVNSVFQPAYNFSRTAPMSFYTEKKGIVTPTYLKHTAVQNKRTQQIL